MRIKITSDSTCDLSPQQLLQHDIELFALYVHKDGESFRDGVEIQPAQIFEHVAHGGALCSTAAVNPADYAERFSKLSKEYDAVIHIDISAEFSSCFQNAKIAAEEFNNVYVVDSRNLSTGHGLVVLEAAEMAESGVDAVQIVERLNEITSRVEASFIVERLDYLWKGGRCSSVTALGANMLKLRPCIDVKNGKMQVGRKYRGSYKKCVYDYVTERLKGRTDIDHKRIFITHTPVSDEALQAAREAISENMDFGEIVDTNAGCTVSCHCGPGTLGVLFITK